MNERCLLCVLPAVPSPNTGGGTLIYEVLAYLRTRGVLHVVVPVVSHLTREYEALRHDAVLDGVEWHMLTPSSSGGLLGRLASRFSRLPGDVRAFATPANQRLLDELRARCRPTAELMIASKAAAPYRGMRLPSGVRVYMMDVDPAIVRYDGPSLKRRIATAIERPKVDAVCRTVLKQAGRIGSISPKDVPTLNQMGGRTDVMHVPPLMRPRPVNRGKAQPWQVLITTNFTYPPNVRSLEWFLRDCWPLVNDKAQLTVTGKDENNALAALCSRSPRVTYAGCVSAAELDTIYSRSAVAVNPTLSGSGFQIKLLDAIARGVPVVSTAFSNRLGDAIPSADDPRELARLIDERLVPAAAVPFDYQRFYEAAMAGWDEFLFALLPA
jgi:hypothetical protein